MAENILKRVFLDSSNAKTAKLYQTGCRTSVISFSNFSDAVKLQSRAVTETYAVAESPSEVSLNFVGRTSRETSKAEAFAKDGSAYVVHTVSETSGDKTDYLEFWSSEGGVEVFNMSLMKKHEQIVNGDQFSGMGGLALGGALNERVVYIAEKKRPEKYLHYGKGDCASGLNEFQINDSWGEGFSDVTNTDVCIFNRSSKEVTVLDLLDSRYDYCSPTWISDDTIAAIGYKCHAFKLGVLYSNNRESDLFVVNLTTKEVACPSKNYRPSCYSWVIGTPDSKSLVAVANDPMGPHMQFKAIVKFDLNSHDVTSFGNFAIESIPRHPWITANTFCVNIYRKSRLVPETFNIETSEVLFIGADCSSYDKCSLRVLDCFKNLLVLAKSSFSEPEKLVLCSDLEKSAFSESLLPTKTTDYDFFVRTVEYETKGYYLVGPKDQSKPRPCILFIHGGPHTLFVNYFDKNVAFFVELGFNIVLVNYTGSLGFTEESLKSLGGQVGSSDVSDCFKALQAALDCPDWKCDRARLAVTGGSHGGFLSLHMIGQYPDTFKACSVRNPVTNIGSMLGVTDIPDWCEFEASGTQFEFNKVSDPEFYSKAWSKSPMSHVHKVITPTQVHLGLKDRRVPPSQGREYYHALLGQGKAKTVLYEYPEDCHPLALPKASTNFYLETYRWFIKHLELDRFLT